MNNQNNFIGKRGYSLYKDKLTSKQINKIKKDCMVKPFIPKSNIQIFTPTFPIYRESKLRLYVPRYYGIEHYGDVENNISKGDKINIEFNGKLRDYQTNIVKKYVNYVGDSGGGLLEVDTGLGKTVIALNIISEIKYKTLIIVHKEFLMTQWIERIEEFLPGTRVGKIQGKTIDIEDKDIVIGMLQSLSMKDYDNNLFSSFGLCVIDEVHHLGAEVFSQALFKVVTNYTLGLSATMQRKDGLTKVFQMFLGNIIHTEKRDTSKANVLVQGIQYKVNDDEFNETILDSRGNAQYSTMISKLCSYNRRSELIVKIVDHLIKNGGDKRQIMILGHNKVLLHYLYDSLKNKNIANGSIGYYMGGMKQDELKESETKQVIIGTYSMASEGLDIKTLNTLIMATPKSDIVQTVGRILRSDFHQPLVVDLIDSHDVFKRQYYTRNRFYKKQNYKVEKYTSDEYFEKSFKNNNTLVDGDKEQDPDKGPGKCLIRI